jgi:crotonobetainyl-CoA:carnitine CoA-transferase CaiB-like acyl-CoA transferase
LRTRWQTIAPPRLGEHTREQLARLGFDAREIYEMIASGAAASS